MDPDRIVHPSRRPGGHSAKHPCPTREATTAATGSSDADATAEVDASAVAFTPRDGSRWAGLLTGDVALGLLTETDRPVPVLPDVGEGPP